MSKKKPKPEVWDNKTLTVKVKELEAKLSKLKR